MENNIPTAEEFATEHNEAKMPRGVSYQKEIGELMIEFAKLHVQAALKEASKMGKETWDWTTEECNSIIEDAYPLYKIK